MPYSQSLFERIRDLLPHAPTKRMFGGIVFFERGMMKVGVFGDAMMVRVGAEAFAHFPKSLSACAGMCSSMRRIWAVTMRLKHGYSVSAYRPHHEIDHCE
jgi:hypothetical protein